MWLGTRGGEKGDHMDRKDVTKKLSAANSFKKSR
jgi:hypothetical protein